MPSLPLRAQLAIRNYWTDPESSLQKSISQLSATLGLGISINPEWPQLITALDQTYGSDRDRIVATLARCTEAWCKSLARILDDDVDDKAGEWADILLERIQGSRSPQQLRVSIEVVMSAKMKEVVGAGDVTASTAWNSADDFGGFVLKIPQDRIISSPADCFATFTPQFLGCFDIKTSLPLRNTGETGAHATSPSSSSRDAEAWTDVMDVNAATTTGEGQEEEEEEAKITSISISKNSSGGPSASSSFLPDIATLPRPEDLLSKPPYHLIIRDQGPQQIEITSSHSASIELLAEYLRRWCRVNHHDSRNPPAIQIALRKSPWGLATLHDRLVLTTTDVNVFPLNPCIILTLVESVLGYVASCVPTSNTWIFRREGELKKL